MKFNTVVDHFSSWDSSVLRKGRLRGVGGGGIAIVHGRGLRHGTGVLLVVGLRTLHAPCRRRHAVLRCRVLGHRVLLHGVAVGLRHVGRGRRWLHVCGRSAPQLHLGGGGAVPAAGDRGRGRGGDRGGRVAGGGVGPVRRAPRRVGVAVAPGVGGAGVGAVASPAGPPSPASVAEAPATAPVAGAAPSKVSPASATEPTSSCNKHIAFI